MAGISDAPLASVDLADSPVASQWTLDAPTASADWISADQIPAMPPGPAANFTGSGTLGLAVTAVPGVWAPFAGTAQLSATVVAIASVTAAFGTTADATGAAGLGAPFAGTGTLSATAFPGGAVTAQFGGAGVLSAMVTGVIPANAPFAGAGTLSATTQVAAAANFTGVGTLSATAVQSSGTAVSVVASSSLAGQGATITVNKPTGVASGDMLIAIASCDSGTSAAMTAPSGWTLLTSLDEGSSAQRMKVWTLHAGASEPSTYAFGQVSSGADGVVTIVALRNAISTTGSWLYAAPSTATNGTSIPCPSVSGAASGAALLCAVVAEPNNAACTMTAPSGMTLQASTQSTTYNTQGVASLLSPSNPTGTKSFTSSSNVWFSGENCMVFSVVVPHA